MVQIKYHLRPLYKNKKRKKKEKERKKNNIMVKQHIVFLKIKNTISELYIIRLKNY